MYNSDSSINTMPVEISQILFKKIFNEDRSIR